MADREIFFVVDHRFRSKVIYRGPKQACLNRITKIGYENPHCDLIHENGKFANFVRPCDEDTYRVRKILQEQASHRSK